MNVFVPYLAALHQQDLLQQAALQRRAKLSTASRPGVPAWRRTLGALLASVARALDPGVEVKHQAAFATGRGASPLPAC